MTSTAEDPSDLRPVEDSAGPPPESSSVVARTTLGHLSSGLCHRCQRFNLQAFATSPTRTRGYPLREVNRSAELGCEFCMLLSDAASKVEKPEYYSFSITRGTRLNVDSEMYIHMTLSWNYKAPGVEVQEAGLGVNRMSVELGGRFHELREASKEEFCIVADPGSPAAQNGDVSGRYLGVRPSSDDVFQSIETWIRHCDAHLNCNRTVSGVADSDATGSPLPSRCIELAEDGRLLLLETTGTMTGRYITVTHRWNQATEDCKTTVDNYQARISGRGFHALPKLFEDVFTVARRLGIRLVWIDSICIVQDGDSGMDWENEAPRMAQYYQYSVFTIAATARDTTNGILHQYPEDSAPWGGNLARLPYRDRAGTQRGHFYVYRRHKRLVDDYLSSVRESSLLHRGWIQQEWLLSKRILWYSPSGVFLECRSEMPMTISGERLSLDMAGPALRAHLEMKQNFHFTNPKILEFWYSALETYSGCQLTKAEQDRIVALAGLATEVRQVLRAQYARMGMMARSPVYVAGLWMVDIHHGLLWEWAAPTEDEPQRILQAPSWTWAQIKSPVKWPERFENTNRVAKVAGFSFSRRDQNDQPEHLLIPGSNLPDFGLQNMFASLHLRSRLYPVHIRGYLATKEQIKSAALSTGCDYAPAWAETCSWRAICSPANPEVTAGWGSLESLPASTENCADIGIAVHAFHVSTRFVETGWIVKRSDPVLDVLLLEETESGQGYCRLGVGRIGDPDLIEDFLAVQEEDIQLL